MHKNEMTDTATAIPAQVDYATLEEDVAGWFAWFLQHIREEFGEEEADRTASEMEATPWLKLQWFVEDNMPAEQRGTVALAPQGVVAALEAMASPEAMLTDSEEIAEAVAQLADHSPDLKGLEHVGKCMSYLMVRGDYGTRAPREFEQVAWDMAQGEAFMEGMTREAHAEAFREFLAATGHGTLQ